MSNRSKYREQLHHTPPEVTHATLDATEAPFLAHISRLFAEAPVQNKQHLLDQATQLIDQLPSTSTPGVRAFLRFCITEVLPLDDPEAQTELLFWHLSSMLSEYTRLPITEGGYTIDNSGETLQLLDLRYSLQPNVLDVSSRPGSSAESNRRYAKEAAQITRLLEWLTTHIPTEPHPTQLLSTLQKQGWRRAQHHISPEAAKKLAVSPQEPYLVGPKALYCMPSSSVHPGGMSVLVLVQPTYLLHEHKFVLLHDQQMLKLTQIGALQLLSRHGSASASRQLQALASKKNRIDPNELETTIMSELLELPLATQLATPQSVFSHVITTHTVYAKISQFWTKRKLNKGEQSVKQLSAYLLTTLKQELLGSELQTDRLLFLEQFVREVVLPTLFGQERITKQKLNTIQQTHQQLRHQPFETFLSGIGTSIPSVFKAFNASGLDCLVGLFNPLNKVASSSNLLSALQTGTLSRVQLERAVGLERAKDWTTGLCRRAKDCIQKKQLSVNPLTHKTWIGECGVCLLCEKDLSKTTSATSPTKPMPRPATRTTPTPQRPKLEMPQTPQLPPATISSFIARLI